MSKCETLVATPQLRWAERKCEPAGDSVWVVSVLQQYWTDPLGASGQGEWRDVPSVTETVTEKQQSVTEPPTLYN